jgi:hypothetical protein
MDRILLSKYQNIFICFALALVTLAVFWQLYTHDFIVYDDAEYITDNLRVQAGLTI